VKKKNQRQSTGKPLLCGCLEKWTGKLGAQRRGVGTKKPRPKGIGKKKRNGAPVPHGTIKGEGVEKGVRNPKKPRPTTDPINWVAEVLGEEELKTRKTQGK